MAHAEPRSVRAGHRTDAAGFVAGVGLLALAGIVLRDAFALSGQVVYGLGPAAAPKIVGVGLVVLGLLLIASSFRVGARTQRDALDVTAVAALLAGLGALILVIGLGGGFIVATALLFTATAFAFGRRAPAADLAIGLGLGVAIYLLFTKLLTLSLPSGPIERLLA